MTDELALIAFYPMKVWHFIILLLISSAVIFVIHDDVRSTAFDYVSGIGSVASVYALIVTVLEIKSTKRTAKETQNVVNRRIKEVNQLLSYAEIEKHIQICSSISMCLKGEQYEAVAIRLEDLKKVLLEIKSNQSIKDKNDYKIQPMVMRLGTDITAVRNKWMGKSDLDTEIIMEHIVEASTYLQEISAKLKHQTI